MSGEELKQYIKRSGLTMSDVARELGTTPQNVRARLGRKTIKIDFIQKIKEIILRAVRQKIALFLADLPQKRLKLFSWIVLRAYHVSGSERKFRGKSGKEHKNTPAVKKSSRWGNKWRPL